MKKIILSRHVIFFLLRTASPAQSRRNVQALFQKIGVLMLFALCEVFRNHFLKLEDGGCDKTIHIIAIRCRRERKMEICELAELVNLAWGQTYTESLNRKSLDKFLLKLSRIKNS